MTPVDGDDMTYWWQVADSAGAFESDVLSDSHVTPTLYGTMTGGEVTGLSLVDVPREYVVQTHAQRTDNALWHMASRLAELADKVRKLEQQLNTPVEKSSDIEFAKDSIACLSVFLGGRASELVLIMAKEYGIDVRRHFASLPDDTETIANSVRNAGTDIASLFEAVRGIQFALRDLCQQIADMTADD